MVSLFIKNKIDYSIDGSLAYPLEKPMQTSYAPTHAGLNIIVLRLKNPALADENKYTLKLLSGSDTVIKSIDFDARNVGDPADLKLQFDPLVNSQEIRSIRLEPVGTSGKLHVYIDEKDRISFTSYYRRSGFSLSWPVLKDIPFFVAWAIVLTTIFYFSTKWQKQS